GQQLTVPMVSGAVRRVPLKGSLVALLRAGQIVIEDEGRERQRRLGFDERRIERDRFSSRGFGEGKRLGGRHPRRREQIVTVGLTGVSRSEQRIALDRLLEVPEGTADVVVAPHVPVIPASEREGECVELLLAGGARWSGPGEELFLVARQSQIDPLRDRP